MHGNFLYKSSDAKFWISIVFPDVCIKGQKLYSLVVCWVILLKRPDKHVTHLNVSTHSTLTKKAVMTEYFLVYIWRCRHLVNDEFLCQWDCTTGYFGDPSMPVGFDPSRINPHIIKNSLADRRLVLSGENAACIWILGWRFGSTRTSQMKEI